MTTPIRATNARRQQREATRRQLLEAGLRVVADAGFAGATTAAIARETGKAHGTVFLHFPSRDALVRELVEEIGRAMSTQLAAGAASESGVAALLDAHLAALAGHEVLYARLLGEAATLPTSARARLFALQSGIAWRLRGALARDRAAGRARDVDPVGVANTWIALTNHYVMNRDLFAPGGSVVAARGAELKALLLALLQP